MFRTLKIALNRRDWSPPRGATHVLEYLPPWQLTPSPPAGIWQLQTLENWLAGTPDGELGCVEWAAGADEADLRRFVEAEFGEQVRLDWFSTAAIPDPEPIPAYWITPEA